MIPHPYRSTPVFDETTLPAALRARHATKAGTWGLLRVLESRVRLTYLDPASAIALEPGRPGLLMPEQQHYVEPLGPMKMQVDFFAEDPRGCPDPISS
jgi:tellurite resistance-related uncharacterized protein